MAFSCVNKQGCLGLRSAESLTLSFLGALQVILAALTLTEELAGASLVSSTEIGTNTCLDHVTTLPGAYVPLSPHALQLDNRTDVIFDVRACSEIHVILYANDFIPTRPRSRVFDVIIGDDENTVIKDCSGSCTSVNETGHTPLNCSEFRRLAVSWDRKLEVWEKVNGSWRSFLSYGTNGDPLKVSGVALAFDYYLTSNHTAEWKIEIPCKSGHNEASDEETKYSGGHLAGSVIAALISGIMLGAVCVRSLPRVTAFIRSCKGKAGSTKQKPTRQEENEPFSEEEVDNLVGVQTSDQDKPSSQQPLAPDSDIPERASNAYTPYHEMGGTATTNPPSNAIATTADVIATSSGSDVRRESAAARATSPLPALPREASVTSSSDNLYTNADAHVYEGMRMDTPVYENREARHYETLRRGEETGKFK